GFPSFTVEGFPGFVIGGSDPSTHIINWVNTNYQILTELLATEGVDVEFTPIPTLDLCGGGSQSVDVPNGGVSPGQVLLNDLVNTNNQAAIEAAGVELDCFLPPLVEWNTTGVGTEQLGPGSCWFSHTFAGDPDVPTIQTREVEQTIR